MREGGRREGKEGVEGVKTWILVRSGEGRRGGRRIVFVLALGSYLP